MSADPAPKRRKKRRKPLDSEQLEALALHYVGRYATSRSKLSRYLDRKIYERGWEGECGPDVPGIVERFAKAGYVDDSAYAAMRARDLAARGYGEGRLRQRLYADGIADDDSEEARAIAQANRAEAAIAFASRRRFGPFAVAPLEDQKAREKALSAMIRAGHSFEISKRILAMAPGDPISAETLCE
ncbi:regulatory protein RecX [Sphingomicrobium clamense]|uniref:Regulatory protein RecX n=1 Tax=Sphingomicrobium clamense TaxID=2851013 RepID=A0ABS6V5U0_9SPHN|nr:RecX family transcriptional regulator [Sphingomicrobium sp. B8]MBW0144562.1 RecX family transcriptional regulator [Sphingomicrobium sp. B8]